MQRPVKWPGPCGPKSSLQFLDQSLIMQRATELGLGEVPMGVNLPSGSIFASGMNFVGTAQSNVGFGDISMLNEIFSTSEVSRQSSDLSNSTICDMGSPSGSSGAQPEATEGVCLPQRLYDALLKIFPYCQNEGAMEGFKELLQVLLTYFEVGPPRSQVDVNYWFKGDIMVRGTFVPIKEGAIQLDPVVVLQAILNDGNLQRGQWTFRNQAANGSYYILTEGSAPLAIPDSKTIYIMVEEGPRTHSPAASLAEEIVGSAAHATMELNREESWHFNDYKKLLHMGSMNGSQDGSGLSGSQSPVGSLSDGASPVDGFFNSEEDGFGGFGKSLHEVLGHSCEQEWLGGQRSDPRIALGTAAGVHISFQAEDSLRQPRSIRNSNVASEALGGGSSPQSLNNAGGNTWMKPSPALKPVVTTMAGSGSAAPKEEWEKLNLFHKLCNLGQSVPDVRMGVDISWVPWKLTEFREGQTKLHGHLRWKKKGKYWERDMTVKDDNRDRGKWSMHSASREWIHEVDGRTENIIKRYFKWMPKPGGGVLSEWTWILHEYVSVEATNKYSVYEEPEPGPNFTGLFVLTCTRAHMKDAHGDSGRKLPGGNDDNGNGRHNKKKKHSNDHYGGGSANGGIGPGFGGAGFAGGYQGGNQMHNMRMAVAAVIQSIDCLSVSGEDIGDRMIIPGKGPTSDLSGEAEVVGGTWDSDSECEEEEDVAESVESCVGEGVSSMTSAPPGDGPIWAGAFGRGDREDRMDGEKQRMSSTSEEAMEQLQMLRAGRVVSHLQLQPERSLLKMFMGNEENEATPMKKTEDAIAVSSTPVLEVRQFSPTEFVTMLEEMTEKDEATDEYFRTTKGSFNGALLSVKQLRVRCEAATFAKIVESQALLNHPNLARIVGYCAEVNNQALVYEIGGSLSLHMKLHPAEGADASPLNWQERLRICFGAASALNFLHNNWELSRVHGDMSSKAVLVDEKNGAQVINCVVPGLVAVSGKNFEASDEFMNDVEYYQLVQGSEQNSKRTKENDVYAFGVMAFELLSGRKPFDSKRGQSEMRLVEWARSCVAADKVEKILDPAMISMDGDLTGVKLAEAQTLADIAMRCTHRGRTERPVIGEVVRTLSGLSSVKKV